MYYNYYFLYSSLKKPQKALTNLKGVSYNLESITNIFLNRFQFFVNQNKQLWIIDYDSLLLKFMEGLINLAMSKLDMYLEKGGGNKLDSILELLKLKR